MLKPAFTAELCDFVECCLRRDPKARLTAEELLAHPFLVRHRNKANSSSSRRPHPKAHAAYEDMGNGEEAAKEGGDLFDGWGSTSSLFRPLETTDASAMRLFSALLRHLNSANAHEKSHHQSREEVGGGSGAAAALPLVGLRDDQLASLCAQLPSLTLDRARAMHKQALEALQDEDARVVAMAAARVRAAAQAQEASLKAAASAHTTAIDATSKHRRRGHSSADRSRRRESRK